MTCYRLLLLLTLTLAAMGGGCGLKKDGDKKDDKKDDKKGEKEAPPGPPPTKTEGDPRAATAKRISEVLADQRKGVEYDIGRINKAAQIARDETRFADLKVVQNLQSNAAIAISAANQLNEELLALDRELRHAQNAYAAAAQAFKDRAEDYSDSSLRETCLGWARHYDALAARIPAERERIAGFLKALPETLDLCRQTKRLLDDYVLFLTTYHDATVPGEEAAKYQATLRGYIQKFSAFERAAASYRGG